MTAVELDAGLAAFLRDRFAEALEPGSCGSSRATRSTRTSSRLVEPPYDVVANLPYHITSPILHALLGAPPRPERLVLMVQREVAERIAAPPGKMSYLSVFVQYHARVRIAFTVPPDAFEPAPAVGSAVIVVEPFDADDRLDPDEEDELWRLVQASFRERRKMLHNVLTRQLPFDAGQVTAALAATGIDPDRRPQTLAVGEWLALREALGPIGAGPAGPTRGAAVVMTATDPFRRLAPVVRLAPAKLNLTLAVVGRRPDGFHELHSVFVPLALADRLSLAPAGGHARHACMSRGSTRARPTDNVVFRALAATRAAVGGGWPGGPGPAPALAARLEKRIPVAAGLAGGSSDAAAAIDGALEAWGAELDAGRPPAPRGPARFGRAVLRGRWSGAHRGSRGAGGAAPRAARLAGRAARDAGDRRLDPRRLRGLRRAPGRRRRLRPHVVGPPGRGASLAGCRRPISWPAPAS